MGDQVTINFIGYTFIMLAAGGVVGWFLREIVFNAIANARPKRNRTKATPHLD